MAGRYYEGMFLLEPTLASQEWENIKKQVVGMLEKREAVIISARKWGDRKLAYEIKGHKRGIYLLVYFQIPPQNLASLKRDLQLSEIVLRSLILLHKKEIKETAPEDIAPQEEEQNVEEEVSNNEEQR